MAISSFYQKLAGNLKKLGLIDYDLRKNLSTGQKSRISKLSTEWGHVLRHPEYFHSARVSETRAKQLKDIGFKVTPRGVAYVPLYEYESAKITPQGVIHRSGKLTEKTFFTSHKTFHKTAEKLLNKPIKRNQMYTARIGDNGAFNSSYFGSYSELIKYLQTMDFKDKGGKTREEMYSLVSLVTIDGKRMTESEANNVKIRRKLNAKKKAGTPKGRRT